MTRLIGQGRNVLRTKTLFNPEELADLRESLAATLATAELLGRTRIRIRQRAIEANEQLFSEQPTNYADTFTPNEAPRPLPPLAALNYFRSLVPELGVDPKRFGERMARQAFTLSVATDKAMLRRVKNVITQSLETGVGDTEDVQNILDAAGVSPKNPQYADMVYRTNCQDAYNTGSERELQDPDVIDTFPVWKYLGIRDGRQGKDHEPKFDRYYPSSVLFSVVRGDRPFNCRCSAAPVDKFEWARLKARGARLETSW